jgi:hypothetical protein
MEYVVSYNPDTEKHDVLLQEPFRFIKSFTNQEDAFDLAKQLTNKNNSKKK